MIYEISENRINSAIIEDDESRRHYLGLIIRSKVGYHAN